MEGDGGDLVFNAIDWHAPMRTFPGKSAEPEAMEAYRSWAGARFTVFIFGTDAAGKSVALKVTGFRPYFYVRGPEGWSETKLTNVATEIVTRCSPRSGPPPISAEIVHKRDMWGFAGGRLTPFIDRKSVV